MTTAVIETNGLKASGSTNPPVLETTYSTAVTAAIRTLPVPDRYEFVVLLDEITRDLATTKGDRYEAGVSVLAALSAWATARPGNARQQKVVVVAETALIRLIPMARDCPNASIVHSSICSVLKAPEHR